MILQQVILQLKMASRQNIRNYGYQHRNNHVRTNPEKPIKQSNTQVLDYNEILKEKGHIQIGEILRFYSSNDIRFNHPEGNWERIDSKLNIFNFYSQHGPDDEYNWSKTFSKKDIEKIYFAREEDMKEVTKKTKMRNENDMIIAIGAGSNLGGSYGCGFIGRQHMNYVFALTKGEYELAKYVYNTLLASRKKKFPRTRMHTFYKN